MSNISNTHSIIASDDFKALSGQRTVSVWFKQTEKMKQEGKEAIKAQSVSIPFLSKDAIEENMQALMPHVIGYLETVQKKIITKAIEAGKTEIHTNEIDVTSCINYLDAEAKGDKLSEDDIKSWFDASLATLLTVSFADKLGVSDTPSQSQTETIDKMINVVKGKLASLSSPKVKFSPIHAEKIIGCLKLIEGDNIADRFISRLEAGLKSQEDDMMSLL